MPPKKYKRMTKDTQIIVRMNEKLKAQLQKAAHRAGISLSEYMRTLGEESLKNS